jgi:hypothetical protein
MIVDDVSSTIAFDSSLNVKSSRSFGSCSSSLAFFRIDDLTGVVGPRLGDFEILRFPISDIGERERENEDDDECKRDTLVSISRYQTE